MIKWKSIIFAGVYAVLFASCQAMGPEHDKATEGIIVFRAEIVNGASDEPSQVSFDNGYQVVQFGPAHVYRVKSAERVIGLNDEPAIYFEIVDKEAQSFRDFTGHIAGSRMAIEIEGKILLAPTVDNSLPGMGVIEVGLSGISEEELEHLLSVLNGEG